MSQHPATRGQNNLFLESPRTTPRGCSSVWNPGIELTRRSWAYLSDPKGHGWSVYSLETLVFFWPHKAKHLQVARPGAPVDQDQAPPLEFPPPLRLRPHLPRCFPQATPDFSQPRKSRDPAVPPAVQSQLRASTRAALRLAVAPCVLAASQRPLYNLHSPWVTAPRYFAKSPHSGPDHRSSLTPLPADIPRSLLPLTLPIWSGHAAYSCFSIF